LSCNGSNNGSIIATVSGGTIPYSYSWNTNPVQTTATASNLPAGTYTLTVTDDNGCTTTVTASVAEPDVLTAGITTSSNVSCNGAGNGSAIVVATGGRTPYSYSWNSNPVQTTATASNLQAG